MHTTSQIRKAFLDFFARNGHAVLPSSSLVPHNDPTLMFTNAGMNQFKNIFTGVEKAPTPPRAATSQKCVRAGGKHNDLDNVGYTARHHTFFEMLGNFSFGDYFKEQAIEHAWELLTKDFGLNKDKLCVTVYHDDDTAWSHWKKLTGFADHRIIRISTNDNFWSMGDTGPCGPCSEIFYDHGEHIAGGPPGSPEQDGDRFIEIWNLVFMQYEQVDAATRVSLPKPSIDTGMGLERLTAVLQGVHDNYDIDLFQSLIRASREISGNSLASHAVSHRVIADHMRSSCFLIADGVMPSNEGRGYVLRRILRRAMRHAHQLGCKDPLMHKLVPALVSTMGEAYPELKRAEASLKDTLLQEEERFKQMLDRGLKLLDEETDRIPQGGMLPGEAAFKLYDTYGFPLDLTQDILRGRNITVDTDGFEKSMEGQREMARAAYKGSGDTVTSKLWFELKEKHGATEFVGYDTEQSSATVLDIVKDGESVTYASSGEVYVILDQTPFYGESGGQVGDTGHFFPANASNAEHLIALIKDTQKPVEDFVVHKAFLEKPLQVGDKIITKVDSVLRSAIRANHSATHLLHKALREKLGDHVSQKGSLVTADRLRFDFSNNGAVSKEDQRAIEARVNTMVLKNTKTDCRVMKPEDAINAGAMALFGEKYGDEVRVLSMGEDNGKPYSVELCGGTHVRTTGDIGAFRIISEGSVASGIRRVEAVTGEAVRKSYIEDGKALTAKLEQLYAERTSLGGTKAVPAPDISVLSTAPTHELHAKFHALETELAQRIEAALEENKKLQKQLADKRKNEALTGGITQKDHVGGAAFVARLFDDVSPKDLRDIALAAQKEHAPCIVVAATGCEGKASLVVVVSPELTGKNSAVALVQTAVEIVGGKGGGGKPDMAQGGGPEAGKLQSAVDAIKAKIAA